MSYGASAALQAALYQTLLADGAVTALVGTAIYDAVPAGQLPPLYLSIGAEAVTARGDTGGSIARHRVTVSAVAEAAGFQAAKMLAAAVSDALDGVQPALDRGRIVRLRFERAQALRVARNRKRRIDLRFEALIDAD